MNRQFPLFSVILTTYNRTDSLSSAISSVVGQSVTDWELLIIDDGSTDQTNDELKKFPDNRIKYCRQEHNERSVARNLGISISTGQYICFLDDDDEFKSNHLQLFADYIMDHQYPDTIIRTGFIIQDEGGLTHSKLYGEETGIHPVNFFSYEMCGIWSLCIPRQFLQKEQFPGEFPHWQDSHLALRLLALYPFKQLEDWTYVYHQHDEMGSKLFFKGEELVDRVELQVQAIEDLFLNAGDIISPYLMDKDQRRLIAEKYIRGARLLSYENRFAESWNFVRKAPFTFELLPSFLKCLFLLIYHYVKP